MKTTIKVSCTLLILIMIGVQQGKLFGWKPFSEKQAKTASISLKTISLQEAKGFFPQANSVSTIDTSWVEVLDKSEQKLGELILTSPYSDKIVGFAGATPLMIVLDKDEKIAKVELLENSESPDYVQHVRDNHLFEAWNGLTLEQALAKKVDAVSGATYTSTGVIESLKARLSVIANAKEANKISWSHVAKQGVQIALLVLALYAFFNPKKAKKVRLPLLFLSLIILGCWQSSMLSLAQFLTWLTNGVPLSMQIGLFLIFVCSILLPIFTGKAFYCVYLCPFGAAQELVGKVSNRKYVLRRNVSKVLRVVRKAILIGVVIILIAGVNFDLSYIEPFSAFNASAASLSAILIAIVSLVLSLFIHKPWCHYLCPAGAAMDWMKRKNDNKVIITNKKEEELL